MVALHDGFHDRQSQTRAAGLAGAGAVAAGEACEQLVADGRIDARSVVVHAQHGILSLSGDAEGDGRPCRRVRAGVREQVRDDLMHPTRIADDRHGLVGDLDAPVVVDGRRACVREPLERELREVDGAVHQLAPLIETGEQEKVFDESGHAQRLGLDALQGRRRALDDLRALIRGARLVEGAQRQLRVAADGCEGSAQLVAGVGDELSHPLLVLLPGRERGVHVIEQLVQGRADESGLRARVRLGGGHPLGDGHLAAVELLVRDPGRGRGDSPERTQAHADRDGGGQGEQDQAAERRQDDHGEQLRQLVLDLIAGESCHDDDAAAGGQGHEAV